MDSLISVHLAGVLTIHNIHLVSALIGLYFVDIVTILVCDWFSRVVHKDVKNSGYLVSIRTMFALGRTNYFHVLFNDMLHRLMTIETCSLN